jgi:hypothetical protein
MGFCVIMGGMLVVFGHFLQMPSLYGWRMNMGNMDLPTGILFMVVGSALLGVLLLTDRDVWKDIDD